MDKILKPYTIIPSHLYVKRDADRQLLNIIEDMGRPGYVLVSRQMGKTNLLLNAKREAETPNDIFVYIDLSNPFNSAKECFENIIDTILDIKSETLEEVASEIMKNRSNASDVPAHKQHISELRKIIQVISGKLVIILDEIDALTKTAYSDRIFSQIRSNYFTRVNFPELERLTYILSGVAEPSEIIKDSKISPFNIGQKIFLNDFDFDEFLIFAKNAKLNLSKELLTHIYSWTNGNPRITWDVCSEIENTQLSEVTPELVDEIIRKLYLTSYDKPPIDNIRELIKADSELRNAIVEIEYKKGKTVSDRIKSKLYLAGIINYSNEDIKIKNEVINKAINLDWITSINEEEKGLVKIALEHFEKGEFAQCLNSFKRFLQGNAFPISEGSLYYYYMGYSAYRISLLDEALEHLENTDFDEEDETRMFYLSHNLKGLLHLYLGDYEMSLKNYKIVLSREKKDEIYARALVNFGSASLQSDNEAHIKDAKAIFTEIVDGNSIDSSKVDVNFLNEVKSISLYNLALIAKMKGDVERTISYYKQAVSIAPTTLKPKIILSYISVLESQNDKAELLQVLVNLIDSAEINLEDIDLDKPMNFHYEQFKEVVVQIIAVDNDELYKKAKLILRTHGSKCLAENLYEIAIYCINENLGIKTAIKILDEIYENRDNLDYAADKDILFKSLKLLSFFSSSKDNLKVVSEYIQLFQNYRSESIDFIDIENFAHYIYLLIENKEYDKALKHVELIKSYKRETSEQFLINFLVIHNLELNIHISQSNELKSKATAEQIIEMANDSKIVKHKSSLLGKDGLSVIRANAENILKPVSSLKHPMIRERKIGRNEKITVRYSSGKTKRAKYKYLKPEIESGECIII